MIRGKLFPDRYLHPHSRLLISSAFVVLSRVGCLKLTGVVLDRESMPVWEQLATDQFFQTGIYTHSCLLILTAFAVLSRVGSLGLTGVVLDFSKVCCSLSRWLFRGSRCGPDYLLQSIHLTITIPCIVILLNLSSHSQETFNILKKTVRLFGRDLLLND